MERLSAAGLFVIGEELIIAVVERAAREALEPHHLPAQKDPLDSLIFSDVSEAVDHAVVPALRGHDSPADGVDRVHDHNCGKHREIGVEPADQHVIGLHLQRVVDAEVGASEEEQPDEEDMCAFVNASQSVLFDRFGKLLDDGDAAVVDPVGQHLPHVLKRVKGKGYDAGRSDTEGRVDVEVLSGREVVMIMECFLKEFLYPKDKSLAGEYPQHVR